MSKLPRLLPLIGVAVGGVLVVKTLAGIEGAPAFLAGARAWAEDVAAPRSSPAADAAAAKTANSLRIAALAKNPPLPPPTSATASAPKAAPLACAPSAAELARAASLSPAELQVLQSLGTRRGQLDQREKDMDSQLQLLAAASAKLDSKLKAMQTVKGEITALLGQVDQKQEAETTRLVSVYSKMKPRDAAAVIATLDDKVRVPVASKMSDRALAAVMSALPPAEAKHLTEMLARRYANASEMASAIANPPPAAPEPEAVDDPKAAAKPAARPPAKPAPRKAARAATRRPAAKPEVFASAAAKAQEATPGAPVPYAKLAPAQAAASPVPPVQVAKPPAAPPAAQAAAPTAG